MAKGHICSITLNLEVELGLNDNFLIETLGIWVVFAILIRIFPFTKYTCDYFHKSGISVHRVFCETFYGYFKNSHLGF